MRLRATLTIPGDTYGRYSAFLEHAGDLTGGQDPVALDRPSLSMAPSWRHDRARNALRLEADCERPGIITLGARGGRKA